MGIEFKILNLIQNMRTPVGDAVMCFITRLGDAGSGGKVYQILGFAFTLGQYFHWRLVIKQL